MKRPKICPFCSQSLPLRQEICKCGAYRVNEENYHLTLKEREIGGKQHDTQDQ